MFKHQSVKEDSNRSEIQEVKKKANRYVVSDTTKKSGLLRIYLTNDSHCHCYWLLLLENILGLSLGSLAVTDTQQFFFLEVMLNPSS